MRYWFTITCMLMVLVACAQLPKIEMPTASTPRVSHIRCRELFPQGNWQMHHAIEATIGKGDKTLLTGVTIFSSQDQSIHLALMTVEGFVLFSGRYNNGRLTVDRAIAPFDRPRFAQGLMDDLKLLFFAPQAPLCMTGQVNQQDRICRYCRPDQTIDIIVTTDPTWQIRQYTSRKRLVRAITINHMTNIAGNNFARELTLTRKGLFGYQLDLKLLEAVPVK